MLDFAGADAESQRRAGAMRAGVRIAADHGHARQRRAVFRPDHMNIALLLVEEGEIDLGLEFLDVLVQRLNLDARHRVGDAIEAALPVAGRRVVVGSRHHRIHTPHRTTGQFQAFIGLRTGDFMHQMAVDINQRRPVRLFANEMTLPKLVV